MTNYKRYRYRNFMVIYETHKYMVCECKRVDVIHVSMEHTFSSFIHFYIVDFICYFQIIKITHSQNKIFNLYKTIKSKIFPFPLYLDLSFSFLKIATINSFLCFQKISIYLQTFVWCSYIYIDIYTKLLMHMLTVMR